MNKRLEPILAILLAMFGLRRLIMMDIPVFGAVELLLAVFLLIVPKRPS